MFTGIVQASRPIVAFERGQEQARLVVELGAQLAQGLVTGASVAIDGVCLTAVEVDAGAVHFDVIAETLRMTTLGVRVVGDAVNVERSMRAGDEIGGHRVSGHVMGTGEVVRRLSSVEDLSLLISLPHDCRRYVLYKGFIAVDGCSLTVGEIDAEGFWIHLIPETRRRTNLGSKQVGSSVNLEPDPATVAIVETVERVLEQRGLSVGS